MDYYLKAADEAALWTALVNAGAAKQIQIKDSEGNIVESKYVAEDGFSIDVIGVIFKETGNFIQQTVDGIAINIPEKLPLEGFHANLRGPALLGDKVEYVEYKPTEDDLENPDFVMPMPERVVTPGPLSDLLVYPAIPFRVWF